MPGVAEVSMLQSIASSKAAYRAAYRAQQAALKAPLVRLHRALRAFGPIRPVSDGGAQRAIERRFDDLLERDLRNVERGLYPASLLFQIPLGHYARRLPRLIAEVPRIIRRARRNDYTDLPASEDLARYPSYFRRAFHWQTDGYLSRHSAEIYELSVEFLFLGAADVMRRQVIAPLAEHFAAAPATAERAEPRRILDVACGVGSTLRQLAHVWPDASYHGLDLSPHYVQVARKRLEHVRELALVAENAEHMPYRDGYFDAVVSVYLFHELPKEARRRVLAEMWRVLAPGGVLVIEDSAQLSDAGEIAVFLEAFSREMHEPYYRGYIRDDLSAGLRETGFEVERVDACYVAKVVVAKNPAAT
jgi:ubiquinone/menaquinone biosynthesis C-methylase UbiE